MSKKKPVKLKMGVSGKSSGPTSKQLTLPERVAQSAGKGFEDFWQFAEKVRRHPEMVVGGDGPWQPWCYLPVNIINGILGHIFEGEYSMEDIETRMTYPARLLTAACAWRMTKGVYVFDPEVLTALIETRADEEPPDEMFLRLPEWCPYLVTPGLETLPGIALHGFFAYVDDRGHGGRKEYGPELNFELIIDPVNSTNDEHLFLLGGADPSVLIEASRELDPSRDLRERILEVCRSREFIHSHTNVPLGAGSFLAATTRHLQGIMANPSSRWAELGADAPKDVQDEVLQYFAQVHAKLGSLLLYLVSDRADLSAGTGNAMQAVVATERRGLRTFQARQIKQWEVGYRIGAQIRAYELAAQANGASGDGAGMRPHVRKAHWHSFWLGPRDKPEMRRKRVRWLPPIPVNVEGSESLVPTVHKVVTDGPVH